MISRKRGLLFLILEEHQGRVVSGEEIGRQMGTFRPLVEISAGGTLYQSVRHGDYRSSEAGKKLLTITNCFPNSVISSFKALLWYLSDLVFLLMIQFIIGI